MNLSIVKQFLKRRTGANGVPHAVSARRLLGVAVLAVWALGALPAHAQDQSPDADDNTVSVQDAFGPDSADEKANLPSVALTSQIVITMLGSAVVSQISVADLTYAASYVQSRNFRAFETYFLIAGVYFLMALVLRAALSAAARRLFARNLRGAR